jgi:hypothetical protein
VEKFEHLGTTVANENEVTKAEQSQEVFANIQSRIFYLTVSCLNRKDNDIVRNWVSHPMEGRLMYNIKFYLKDTECKSAERINLAQDKMQ